MIRFLRRPMGVGFCFSFLLASVAAQESKIPAKNLTIHEVWDILKEPVNLDEFPEELTIGQAKALWQNKIKAKGKDLPILLNVRAFREEEADLPDIEEMSVKLQKVPRIVSGFKFLEKVLAEIPVTKTEAAGVFMVKPGYVEITTQARTMPARLLWEKISVHFQRRPLKAALEDIYEMTGVEVILDPRTGPFAQTPITARFTGLDLGTALLLMSEMSNLKLLVGDKTIFITTPLLAQQFLWERAMNPYQLPSWNSPGRQPYQLIHVKEAVKPISH